MLNALISLWEIGIKTVALNDMYVLLREQHDEHYTSFPVN